MCETRMKLSDSSEIKIARFKVNFGTASNYPKVLTANFPHVI